jgi:hypothetical protein
MLQELLMDSLLNSTFTRLQYLPYESKASPSWYLPDTPEREEGFFKAAEMKVQ